MNSRLNTIHFRDDPDRALAGFKAAGYAIEPDVFSPTECDAVIAVGERLRSVHGGVARPLMNPHREDPFLLNIMADRRIVSIMESLCGGRVSGLQSEFFFGHPGTPGFAPHQDNYFVEAHDGTFASAWLALVDVSPENGGLKVYPGSHRRGRLPTETLDNEPSPHQDPNARSQHAIVPAEFSTLDASMTRGSILFIHGWLVHSSHDNTSDRWRHALLNTYIRKGGHFRPGRYAGRSEVDLDG